MAIAVAVLKPVLRVTTRRAWIGGEKIPATGGCLVVLNHVSHCDPPLSAHFVYDHGRIPRYLAKSAIFRVPVVGTVFGKAGQIPVERLTSSAAGAYDAAVEAVKRGECVIVYPEGTLTRDPDLWPMTGKSGAARIALATGCPVIPVGLWGAQDVLAPYSRRLHLYPRRTVTFLTGDPVDLSDLLALPMTAETMHTATERIMSAITVLVEELRGEKAPAVRFDSRAVGVTQIGNPKASKRRSRSIKTEDDR